MGRPPCCDKAGVKKGPWTPEEDIMLVSYVQEHGSGNWRAVPTCTGLRRCSKSCRLRWTNYLRPGIKRGSFTGHEEKMIIQLQALLGNKWAAIASYLPERTDNDIKNYWNTHLKKKLKRLQNGSHHETLSGNDLWSSAATPNNHHPHSTSRGRWERRLQANIHTAKQALEDAISLDGTKMNSPKPSAGQAFSYASSTENIARLLKDWVKESPEHVSSKYSTPQNSGQTGIDLSEAFESLFGFEKFEPSNSDGLSGLGSPSLVRDDGKPDPDGLVPLSAIDDWLVDEQGKDYLINFTFDEHSDSF